MKNSVFSRVRLAILCCVVLSLSGCMDFSNVTLPKDVSVKTKAKYNFAVANVSKDLSSLIDFSQLTQGTGNDQLSLDLMKYCPEGTDEEADKLQLLSKITLQEIPIDFASYLSETSLDSVLSSLKFEQEIAVPAVAVDRSEVINMDSIKTLLGNLIIFGGTGSGDISFNTDNAALNSQNASFKSVTYKSGKLVFNFSVPYTGTATISYNGQECAKFYIVNSKTYTGSLPENFTFYKTGMSISFGNTVIPTPYICNVKDGVVSKATGVTLSDIKIGIDTDLPTADMLNSSSDGSIESCTIEKGKIILSIVQPEGWTGLTFKKNIVLTGGIQGSTTEGTDVIDLAGTEIKAQDTNLKADLTISFLNSNIDFEKNLAINAKAEINTIGEIALELKKLETSKSYSQELPAEVVDKVKSIDIASTMIGARYINTLPAGNDISISIKSNFLKLDQTQTVYSGTSETEKKEIKFVGEPTVIKLASTPSAADEFNSVDVLASFSLPGATTEKPKRMVLKHVSPGETYKLALEALCDIDWNQIEVDISDYAQSGSLDTGVSLDVISDAINGFFNSEDLKVQLESIPVYLYCAVPGLDLFENASFYGSAKIYTNKNNEDACVDLLKDKNMTMSDLPKLEKDEDDVVITNLDNVKASISADLVKIINNAADGETIKFDYNLAFSNSGNGTCVLKKSDLEKTDVKSVAVVAYIAVPLKLKFSKDLNVDLMEMIGMSKDGENADLLNRSGPGFGEDIDKFIALIESACIEYRTKECPFHGDVQLVVDLYNDGTDPFVLTVEHGKIAVDNVKKLLNKYPLNPSVKLVVPAVNSETKEDNWLYISRDMNFSTALDLTIMANGEIPVFASNQ